MSLQALIIFHKITHFLTFPLAVVIAAWYAPRYGYARKKAISYAVVITGFVVLFTYVCKWVPGWFGYVVHLNSYRSFLFIPLFAWMISRIWKIPTLHGMDFMTPIMFFERTMVLVGCTLLGCGLAVECDWGTYNHALGCRVFPMDLIDLLANFVVSIISLLYAKRLNYKGNGRVFALSMYLLGTVRLFIQAGSRERWWGIIGFNDESVYSIVSIVMAIFIYKKWREDNPKNKECK